MRRSDLLDRMVLGAVGAVLVAVAVLTLRWTQAPDFSGELLTSPISAAAQHDWWKFACAAAGVVLVVLGVRWLAAHRGPAKAGRVALPGDDEAALSAEVASVAEVAASVLGDMPGVQGAKARAVVENGLPTITLTATVAARCGLAAGVGAADEVVRTVGLMLGDTVAVRTLIRVDTKRRHPPVR
ncbi:hypothetical protein [Mycolicibacterium arseniciresistens]|uniref:Alkaline shock response membrane anchor protein AmaP n=1 Tax=Mycolicibacterium arseniciresistens TaxID=3062257 RepID=A0ABT8UQR4_9MYCO|nr:hypothetical protein [Mycolicibacterium arseniciresistens]MDO3640130.1 hypothetical protein [Mycolicibacterium arseniciresistens]